VQNDTAAILKVRQERIVEMTGYLDRDEALGAAGFKA
jgi:ketosteroid isomerase-like protein